MTFLQPFFGQQLLLEIFRYVAINTTNLKGNSLYKKTWMFCGNVHDDTIMASWMTTHDVTLASHDDNWRHRKLQLFKNKKQPCKTFSQGKVLLYALFRARRFLNRLNMVFLEKKPRKQIWNTGCSLNIVFFSKILESLSPLPRQHSAAIGCTKIPSQ